MLRAARDRNPFDAYLTPDALALAICRHLDVSCCIFPDGIIEPSAGKGAFVRAARAVWPTIPIAAIEIQTGYTKALKVAGANIVLIQRWEDVKGGHAALTTYEGQHLVVGNPPYNLAQPHIEHALSIMRGGDWLAFLMRLSLLGSQKRAASLWTDAPLRYLIPIAERADFTGGSSDNSEYGVFVWQTGYKGRAEIVMPPISWR